jgi:hypothetical protein
MIATETTTIPITPACVSWNPLEALLLSFAATPPIMVSIMPPLVLVIVTNPEVVGAKDGGDGEDVGVKEEALDVGVKEETLDVVLAAVVKVAEVSGGIVDEIVEEIVDEIVDEIVEEIVEEEEIVDILGDFMGNVDEKTTSTPNSVIKLLH